MATAWGTYDSSTCFVVQSQFLVSQTHKEWWSTTITLVYSLLLFYHSVLMTDGCGLLALIGVFFFRHQRLPSAEDGRGKEAYRVRVATPQ